jgi:hypothetical protein
MEFALISELDHVRLLCDICSYYGAIHYYLIFPVLLLVQNVILVAKAIPVYVHYELEEPRRKVQ